MPMKRRIIFIICLLLLSQLFVNENVAADDGPQTIATRYIILLQDPPVVRYRGNLPDLAATSPAVTGARKLDVNSAASRAYYDYIARRQSSFKQILERTLGRTIAFESVYRWILDGVVVQLTPADVDLVRQLPEVRAVVADQVSYPLTDHGPEWIGAPAMWGSSTGCTANGFCGEGVIIGVLDTGINHDHPSFADVGGDGYDHTNPYGSGVYKGVCQSNPSLCNDKLVGMYDYTGAGTEDQDGHGSHTASIAAGNFLYDATLQEPTITFQVDISGVAPHANIISYRVCNGGCYASYAASAVDQAVADGVDVINYSIGGSTSYSPWNSSNIEAQAFLDAREAGIFVAAAAGNSGPTAETILNPAISPWLLAVGASSHNRAFSNSLVDMTTDPGTTLPDIEGRSMTSGYGPASIVYAGDYDDNNLCEKDIWNPDTFSGEIVVCDRGVIPRVDKSANVGAAGGGGMILANTPEYGNYLFADPHTISSVHITYEDGVALKNWLANGESGHVARISGTVMAVGDQYADIVAYFSSRGPNEPVATQRVIKPDMVGPGVDIVAAYDTDGSLPSPEIYVKNGTSMASPHLAGAGALLVQARPQWKPAEIQSALMSTAWTDLTDWDWTTPANPFEMGAGRADLTVAASAGFLMNVTRPEYDSADPDNGGDPGALNLPSLATDALNNSWTFTRTLKATRSGNWHISFETPAGLSMTATPPSFSFSAAGDTQPITITVHGYGLPQNQWTFAQVHFTDALAASPDAHFPVAVKSTCAPPSAPSVSASLNADDVILSWNAVGDWYEVWRSQSPYFTPADAASQRLTPENYTATTYTDVGAGDGQANYYYKVIARNNACGGASSDQEDQDGVFSYPIVPGTP